VTIGARWLSKADMAGGGISVAPACG